MCVHSCSVSTDHPRRSASKMAHMRRSVGTTSSLRERRLGLPLPRGRRRAPEQSALAAAELERSHALEERLLERAPDGHRLAHRLHLGRERAVRLGELLEVPARNLDDDVIDRRLERGGREPRDVVGDLVEVVAERELGGDLRDREPRRFRRQRRRARHARVHLDDDHPAVGGVHGELDVAAAGLDADTADDPPSGVAHPLIFLVAQRQRRRDRDAVARVHAHRVDVLDRADDDEVVGDVAHHLQLVFLPPDDRLLDQHLVDGAQAQPARHEIAEFLDVVGDAAADAAERERRPDDRRKPGGLDEVERLGQRCGPARSAAPRGRSPPSHPGTAAGLRRP